MINIVVAVIYCIISFITWLSVSFSLIGKVMDENFLFSNLLKAVLTYICGGLISSVMTLISYFLICNLQKVI